MRHPHPTSSHRALPWVGSGPSSPGASQSPKHRLRQSPPMHTASQRSLGPHSTTLHGSAWQRPSRQTRSSGQTSSAQVGRHSPAKQRSLGPHSTPSQWRGMQAPSEQRVLPGHPTSPHEGQSTTRHRSTQRPGHSESSSVSPSQSSSTPLHRSGGSTPHRPHAFLKPSSIRPSQSLSRRSQTSSRGPSFSGMHRTRPPKHRARVTAHTPSAAADREEQR
jgi:hypothetical protein